MSLASWAELLIIALLGFVIIGPRDLPKVLYRMGCFFQALRRLSDEFMSEFEAIHHIKELDHHKEKRKKRNDTLL